ncbi:hypothetical protein [Nocardia otitidiscaviarum]|uniref:hypothetical protein n=1 Tax=Nocardia otitidiscaviarum TaxID=1823 RepID=UPI0024566B46|nr:hypothetical protein [Nocardia otitidiscaviarum]
MGWPLAASQAGKAYPRIGFRCTAVIGSTLGSVGAAPLLLVDADSGAAQRRWAVAVVDLPSASLRAGSRRGANYAPGSRDSR